MNCFQCREDITSTEKHLVCFYCNTPYHLTCLSHVKEADYDYFVSSGVNWKCPACDKKKGNRGDNTPLTPVGQKPAFILKPMGSDGDFEPNTGIKKLCNNCKKGFSHNAYKALCTKCNQLFHFKCAIPVISKDEYLKVKESWVCNICVDEGNRIDQAARNIAPFSASSIDETAGATSFLSTDKTTEMSKVSLSDIMKEMISFRKEVREVNLEFNCTLQKYSDWLEENTRKIDDVSKKLTVVSNNIETLFQENVNLKKKVNDLEVKLYDLEQKEIGNEVEIQGVPYEKGENVLTILGKISEVVGFNFKEEMVDNCYRYRSTYIDPAKPNGIVVRFIRKLDKTNFMNCRRKKRNLNSRDLGFNGGDGYVIYVNDTLTRERRKLLRAARDVKKAKQYSYLWVKNGRIFLRKNEGDRYVIVESVNDLEKLK